MKTYIILFAAVLISISTFAQGIGMNYKAVIKDGSGNLAAGQTIDVQFNILGSGGTPVFSESHTTTTDDNGIIVLIIADGTSLLGNFFDIDWSSDLYQLQVEIDLDQDGTPEISETSGFNAVPYAYRSIDNTWARNGDNTYTTSEKVGIGTSTPTELLHIYDDNKAAINLEVPNLANQSQIELKNGLDTGVHTFFKVSNQSDALSFEIDSDLNTGTGYELRMSLENTGLALQNGARVNEFSVDGTLSGNSSSAIPTESAVKTYIDSRSQSNYWRRTSLSSNGLTTVTSTYQPIGPVLTITKEYPDSNIEVTVNSRIDGGTFSSATFGVAFKIRIDGTDATFDNQGAITVTDTIDFISMFAVFQGLSVGSHTVQIYARTSSTSSSATSSNVRLDPGNWGGSIIAKETF